MNESAIATPGVYISEISVLPPSIAQVSTAIPAFVGYTKTAFDENGAALPNNTPVKIFNLKEYEQHFGTAENETDITVNVVYKKDSSPAIVESATATIGTPNQHNLYYALRLYFDNGGGPCYIVSVGPSSTAGVSNTALEDGINALEAFDEPTLIVVPEGQAVDTASHYYGMMQKAIDQCARLQDRFTLVDVYDGSGNTNTNITNFRGAAELSKDLSYAAAYYPSLKTNYDVQYDEATLKVNFTKTDGTTSTPFLKDLLPDNSLAYYAARAAIKKSISPTLPPTPAIAGIIAQTDANRGVWKAPANVGVSGIYDVTDFVTDDEQATMNVDPGPGKSVNAIRPFTGKGILVWGARTLDGNSSEWRYISVRRFFIMVEESTKKATAQFVFEPNDANTWTKIRAMIENFLTVLWRQGALAGAKPEHAFFVKCGLGQTMTAQDVLDGKLIVEIGMAAVRPAEFIILRFMHKLQES